MIHYRKATPEDIADLVNLRIAFLKEVMSTTEARNEIAGGLEAYFKKHLQQGDYINWLAVDGDKIVATGGICFYSIPPNFYNSTGDRAYILNVYTLPGYRRQGISRKIFEKLMQEAANRNILQVSLHTTDDARNMYAQFGFRPKDNEMVWGKHN